MESALENKNAESIEQKNEIASLKSSLEAANNKLDDVENKLTAESKAARDLKSALDQKSSENKEF